MAAPSCAAIAKSTGKPCRRSPVQGSIYCSDHKVFENDSVSSMGDGMESSQQDVPIEVSAEPTAATEHSRGTTISLPMIVPSDKVVVHDIDSITAVMDTLTMKLTKLRKLKKMMMNMEAEIEKKAMSMYYHHNKTNQVVLADLRTKLQSVGLYLVKDNKERIPYQFVREYTNNNFAQLSNEEKKVYIEEAKKKVRAHVAT